MLLSVFFLMFCCVINVWFFLKFLIWGLKFMFCVIGGRWDGGNFSVGFKFCFLLVKLKWFVGELECGWIFLLIVEFWWVILRVCNLFCRLLFVFCSFWSEKLIDLCFICFCLKFVVEDIIIVEFDFMFLIEEELFCFFCCVVIKVL